MPELSTQPAPSTSLRTARTWALIAAVALLVGSFYPEVRRSLIGQHDTVWWFTEFFSEANKSDQVVIAIPIALSVAAWIASLFLRGRAFQRTALIASTTAILLHLGAQARAASKHGMAGFEPWGSALSLILATLFVILQIGLSFQRDDTCARMGIRTSTFAALTILALVCIPWLDEPLTSPIHGLFHRDAWTHSWAINLTLIVMIACCVTCLAARFWKAGRTVLDELARTLLIGVWIAFPLSLFLTVWSRLQGSPLADLHFATAFTIRAICTTGGCLLLFGIGLAAALRDACSALASEGPGSSVPERLDPTVSPTP